MLLPGAPCVQEAPTRCGCRSSGVPAPAQLIGDGAGWGLSLALQPMAWGSLSEAPMSWHLQVCTAARRSFTHGLMFTAFSSACILLCGTPFFNSAFRQGFEMVVKLRSHMQEENSNLMRVYFMKAGIVFNEKWSLILTCYLCHRHRDITLSISPFLHKIQTKFLLPLCLTCSWAWPKTPIGKTPGDLRPVTPPCYIIIPRDLIMLWLLLYTSDNRC